MIFAEGFVLGVVMTAWFGGAALCFGTEALIGDYTTARSFFFWLGWPAYLIGAGIREGRQ